MASWSQASLSLVRTNYVRITHENTDIWKVGSPEKKTKMVHARTESFHSQLWLLHPQLLAIWMVTLTSTAVIDAVAFYLPVVSNKTTGCNPLLCQLWENNAKPVLAQPADDWGSQTEGLSRIFHPLLAPFSLLKIYPPYCNTLRQRTVIRHPQPISWHLQFFWHIFYRTYLAQNCATPCCCQLLWQVFQAGLIKSAQVRGHIEKHSKQGTVVLPQCTLAVFSSMNTDISPTVMF